MAHWLFKSEPSAWSFDRLFAEGKKGTDWSGIRNHSAKQNMMAMKRGELGFFYHSNEGKAIVGLVEEAMNRLSARAEEHRQRGRASSDEAREAAGREFDSSPLAAELKRQEMFWIRAARRSVKVVLEMRGEFESEARESGGGAGKKRGGRRPAPNQMVEANGRETTKRERRHVG